jgi:hypothetical protein
VLVLLPILIDYFNDYTRARSLDIAAQIKIMEEPSLVFTGSIAWYLYLVAFRKVQDCVMEEDSEDLTDLLVSFRLYFVIFEDSSCISTMYYLLL